MKNNYRFLYALIFQGLKFHFCPRSYFQFLTFKREPLSYYIFAPSSLPSVPFRPLLIFLQPILDAHWLNWDGSQTSELITAATMLRAGLNKVALFKRMKLTLGHGLTTSHQRSSRLGSGLSCLKKVFNAILYITLHTLSCLIGRYFAQQK